MGDVTSIELASLRFDGKRFQAHAIDVECTQELIAYRTLILECAKELWRRKNPGRVRLPNGFEEGFRVQFDRLEDGSAVVPLSRVRDSLQTELDLGDDFDEAAALIDAAIAAADRDDLLPEQFPTNVIPLFASFGHTLRVDEVGLAPVVAASFDETAPPIWEQLTGIGREAPLGTWDAVPDDLSTRIDEVVYGKGEPER